MANGTSVLRGIADLIGSTAAVTTQLNTLCRLAAEAVGETRAFVLIYHHENERLSLDGSFGLESSDFRRLEARADPGSLRSVFDAGEATLLDLDDHSELQFLGRGAINAVPVRSAGKIAGLLCSLSDAGIGEERLQMLELIAAMIGQSLRIERGVQGEREKLREENQLLKLELKEKYDFSHIIGTSGAIRQVYEQVTQVARSNATILLRGESGTGKEMIAHAIHYNSLRAKRPFIKLNCAALPENLIESELFGHERGSFTGADKMKRGRFELTAGGTLFLDEIGDISPQTQVKLLRVLQEREFERVGGTSTISTNIRLITATNKELEKAIADGSFREDLYYRLNVFSIHLPPLRNRRSDILLLAEHFLEKFEAEHDKRIRRISTPAIDMLMAYHYPGNVRELENAIERAVLACDSNVIHGHHLPPTLQTAEVSDTQTRLSLAGAVAGFESDMIQDALKSTGGNIAKAAKMLDSTERILGYKIKKLGIQPARFRR